MQVEPEVRHDAVAEVLEGLEKERLILVQDRRLDPCPTPVHLGPVVGRQVPPEPDPDGSVAGGADEDRVLPAELVEYRSLPRVE